MKKKHCLIDLKLTVTLALVTLSTSINSQILQGEFSIGGANNEIGNSIIQTKDRGYLICGSTNSFGAGLNDVYLAKLDSNANLLWTKTVGGTKNDFGSQVFQTNDSGYVIAGTSFSYGDTLEGSHYLIKLNNDGDVIWTKSYGTGSGGACVIQTSDGKFITAGYCNRSGPLNDLSIIRTDSTGDILWSKVYTGVAAGNIRSVIQTTEGGFAVSGSSGGGSGAQDIFISKLDSLGNIQWTKTIGGAVDEQGGKMIQTSDNCYVITGCVRSYGVCCNYDAYIVKFDSLGNLLWTKTAGGGGLDFFHGYSIVETNTHEIVIAGQTTSFGVGGDAYILKFSSSGTFISSQTIGKSGLEYATSIIQTKDSGYAFTGSTNSFGPGNDDVYFVKLDSNFVPNCAEISSGATIKFGGVVTNLSLVMDVINDTVSGYMTGTGGIITNDCEINIKNNANENQIKIFPNPTSGRITISFSQRNFHKQNLEILNYFGENVSLFIPKKWSHNKGSEEEEVLLDFSDAASGIYFIRCGLITGKIIKD